MNTEINGEYLEIVSDLLKDESVQKMGSIKQHAEGFSCLDHCIFVSYVSFCICKKMGFDSKSAARAGLLHDLHLCDWSKTTVGRMEALAVHPKIAAQNAEQFGISDLEKNIILSHMWPIGIKYVPKYKESAVVNIVDTLCAIAEFTGVHKVLLTTRKLSLMNRRILAGVIG